MHVVADGGVPDHVEILERWSRGLQMFHAAHNIASERFNRWNRVTGITTAMLSAVVGTFVLAGPAGAAVPPGPLCILPDGLALTPST